MIEPKASFSSPSFLLSAMLLLIAMLASGCGSHPTTGTTVVGQIKVTADNAAINAGMTTQLHATNTNSAGQTSDVTSTVNWSSSSPTVAVVSPSGAMTGMAAGSATISASLNGIYGSLGATIGAPAVTGLTVSPQSSTVFTRGTQAFTALATYANNTSGDASAAVSWSVTPTSVATISSNGVVTAVAPGSFGVTAVAGTQKATAAGKVVDAPVSTIAVTPANPSITAGATQKFTALATYADGSTADVSTSFNWASSNPTLLTIDSTGLATAIGSAGSVTVTGQFGAISGKATVTLTTGARLTGLVVTPTSSSIANGTAEPHAATATYSDGTQKDVTNSVTWSVVPGTSSSVGKAGDVHVQGRAVHAAVGAEAGAEVAMDDSSSVVAVDQTGVDWAMSPGITTVQASMGGLQSQSVVIVTTATVQSLAITTSKTLFPAGSTQPMALIGHFSDGTTQDLSLTANWASTDPTVATIDSKGNVTGVKAGKTQMSASFGGLSTSSGNITVLPVDLLYVTIKAYALGAPIGVGEQMQMLGTYSDGTVQDLTSLATWSSANPSVESIESYGFIHPVAAGVTEITGTALGRTATISLAVIDSGVSNINVLPGTPSFALGTTDTFSALTNFSNGVQSDAAPVAVWTSSDPTVLTINSQGRAKAGKIGTATVTASLLGVEQTSMTVQVTGAQLWKLSVSPNTAQIAALTGQQYQAVGFFDNSTVQDITGDVTWSTEDATVARIDENGLLYGVKAGTTHVVCTFENQTVRYPVTVTAATLQSVAVSPANTELPLGVRRQLSLLGTFSDGTTQDLSGTAVWSTSTPAIVGVLGQGIILGNTGGTGAVTAQYGFLSGSTSVTMTTATLTSLALAPQNTTIRVGANQPLTLTGTFSDGFTQVITLDDTFVSSAANVAQVLASDDTAYAVGVGTTQITASYLGMTATTNSFMVLSNVISSLTLTPANPAMTAGGTLQILATATYADGSTAPIGRALTWTSSNPAVLDVDNNGFMTAKATAAPVAVTVTASGGGATASMVVNVSPATLPVATLVSVAVSPGNASFPAGSSEQFVLTATYSDGSTQDVTPSSVWTSSSALVATISSTGLASAISPGSVQFTGSFQGHSASTQSVLITPAVMLTSLVVEPTSSSIATGSAEQHKALALYSDGSQADVTNQVTWSVVPAAASSARIGGLHAQAVLTTLDANSSTVTSVNRTGMNTAMTPGMAMVQASMGGVASQSTVIVTAATVTSLAIRATRTLFPVGSTQPIQLIGTFSDGSIQDLSLTANWVSSDPTVATIDSTGLATGVKAGNVVFSAGFGGLTASTIGYQVLSSQLISTTLQIDYPFLPLGANQQVHVIGTYSDGTTHDLTAFATWQSSDSTVFPINTATGVGYGLAPGAVQITGTVAGRNALLDVVVADFKLSSISVYPPINKLAHNTKRDFLAVGNFTIGVSADISSVVVWRSNDPTILTVDANGTVKPGLPGTTQVTATFLGVTGTSTDITVSPANLVSLSVQSVTPQLAALTGQHYVATGIFDDGSFEDLTNNVLWNTTDNTIASIDTQGFGIGMKPGQTQVTASFQGLSASTPLKVTGATLIGLNVAPGNAEVPLGVGRQFSATGEFSDGTQEDLSKEAIWSSQAPGIAAVILKGEVYGNGPGIGSITARYGSFTAATPVTVTNVALTSMTISPMAAIVRKGSAQLFTTIGTFSDGFTQDLSQLNAGFFSSDQNVVCFFNEALAGAANVGTAVVGAAFRDQIATTSFQVTSNVLSSLAVSPANPSLLVGATQQFTATGTYADGTTGDVTSATTWTSSNPLLFRIDQNGLGTALSLTGLAGRSGGLSALGTTNSASPATVPMTASSGGQTKAFQVTVVPSTLTSVAVSPSSASFAKGTTQQFTLTGTYSDGSTQDLSSQATWTSSAASVGTISSTGLASGAGVGSVQFTGSYGGKTSTTGTVSVTPAGLVSLAVTPSSPSFAKGTTTQFTVTGTYTDGTTQNLTGSSTYTSSNTGVVSVSSGGLATGTGTGSAQVTISSGGQTVTTGTVQVTPATLTGITVNPTSGHAAAGTTVQLTVTGSYTDGSTADVSSSATWTSSTPSLATVNSTGAVTGVSAGLATLQAQVGSMTSSSTVRVSAATLVSVAISPSGASFAAGSKQQFTLTGTFSDGSTQDLSSSATWTTSNSAAATVSSTGLATGVAAGPVQFTASYGGQTATTPTVTVSPATLVSIAVTPANPSFAKGTDEQFHVTGTYSDGSMRDLTNTATFSSSNPNVVAISGSGLGQGLGTGSVQITVSAGGQTASTQSVTVSPAMLTSVAITPSSPSLADGTTQQFTATGTFSDGTTQDLSGQVVWTSSNPQVMTINQTGAGSTFQVGGVQVSATINGMTVTSGVISVTPATLASVSVTPTSVQIAKGTVRQMTATGTYTDGSTQNLSSMATWSTSDGTVATINASGLATGTGIGSATLTASIQGKTASTSTFQVTAATLVSIAFNPANPTVAAGSSSQVSVIGTYSDGSTQDLSSTALYSSSNAGVATVSSTGVVSGVGPGSSTITVQANGVTNSFNVTVSNATLVSIAITPTNPMAFAKGTTQQFTATGTYSDGTTQNLSSSVAWSSSNTAAVSVNQSGLATGTGIGSGQLTAVYQGQTAMTGTFQVSAATVSSLTITPGNASFAVGSTQQYTAMATYSDNTTADVSSSATWSSSNTGVLSINSTGFATGMGAGTAMVQAQYQGLSGAVLATVNQAAATLQQILVSGPTSSATVGGTRQFSATAVYSDMSTMNVTAQSVWTSTNTNVATVNSAGLASLVGAGMASIQAQFGGLTGSANVSVSSVSPTLQSIAISPSTASVAKGLTQQFMATGTYSDGSTQNLTTQVTWMSSNTSYATINANGLATSTTGGQTQISASYQGQTAQVILTVSAATLQSLALTPNSLNLANGTKQQIIATGTLSDGSTQDFTTSVNWSSSNTSNATVSASGVVSSVGVGPVTITAQAGSVNASLSVNVTAATATSVQLTPTSVTVPVGGVQQFQATAMFTDGTSQDVTSSVTYTTSNPNVVTVDANGNLHGVGTGTATVTATLGSASTTTTVTITQVMLNSLAITPQNVSLADGLSQQLTATGTFANGSTQNLTNTVTWTSSNPQVASVSSTGKVSVTGIGTVTITAMTDNVSATDSVTATAATVTTISVSPASTTLAAGQTQQYAATATFTDGSQQTVTSSANWSVSDPTKGSISNSGSTKGFLTTSTAGSLNVVATINSVSGTAPVTVQPAALTVLRITPSPVSAPAGTTQQLTVTGSYTDGSTANVTASTTWATNSASVATVDTNGVLHAISIGSTSVQATVQNVSATDNVTTTAAVLNSIAITPSASSVAKGLAQQLTAIGTYTDGSTANITSQVQWSSSAPSVATVSSTGLVSTPGTGNSTLTATLNSVSQTASLTVTPAVLESIAVTTGNSSFALGLSVQLTATGTYSDGTTQNLTNSVTWSSSMPAVGMVSSTGLATGVTTGGFTARATMSGVTGTLPLTVTPAVLQTIVVTPANQIIVNVGGTTQFTATGHYSDGTTQNLTNSVHWTLTGPVNVGTISQTGQLSGVNVGVAGTVTATLGTITGSTGFTVVGI